MKALNIKLLGSTVLIKPINIEPEPNFVGSIESARMLHYGIIVAKAGDSLKYLRLGDTVAVDTTNAKDVRINDVRYKLITINDIAIIRSDIPGVNLEAY